MRTLAARNASSAPASSNVTFEDRSIGNPAFPIRIYRPKSANQAPGGLPAIISIHGGGWIVGDLTNDHAQCIKYVEELGCMAINVDYHLAPEAPFPAAANDCIATFDWIVENANDLGINADALIVSGISAGGNLAIVVAQHARDQNIKLLGQVLRQPVTCHPKAFPQDLPNDSCNLQDTHILDSNSMTLFYQLYGQDADPADPRLSPLLGNLKDVARAYIQVGGRDPLRDDGLAYYTRLNQAGVPAQVDVFNGVPHGFNLFPLQIASRSVKNLMEAFRGFIKSE